MKSRKFKIKIQSSGQALDEFEKAWVQAKKGKKSERYDLILGFSDFTTLSKVLSPERLRIIQTIRENKPESIRQLARLLDRAQPNVQKDVTELVELQIIELKSIKKPGSKRESFQPTFNWSGFDIAV